MTPEEAIKTIQVAVAEVEWNYPLDYAIAFETAINALENVNRQQAEIEKLKNLKSFEKFINDKIHSKGAFGCDYPTSEARREAFEKELEKLYDIASARVDAIKEFAERYAENFIVLFNLNYGQTEAARELRKRIVKEMVGDNNG